MVWDYLAQFWSLLTAVGDYPVAFFQNIGNAVAGALGGFFNTIFHNLNDFFVLVGWLAGILKNIFLTLLTPITYIFNIARFFVGKAFGEIPEPEVIYTFSAQILEVFEAIPHWHLVSSILGIMVIFVAGIATIKLLLNT